MLVVVVRFKILVLSDEYLKIVQSMPEAANAAAITIDGKEICGPEVLAVLYY